MRARAGGALLAAALLGGTEASAQVGFVFNRTGSGARAAGMANAFIAVSDDGTAASWNPAGLGQLRKLELSMVSSTTGRSGDSGSFRSLDNLSRFSPTSSSYRSTYLDFASLAVPVTLWGKPVTFQGAWRRLYTLDDRRVTSTTREPVSSEGPPAIRLDTNTDLVGGVDVISVAGAVKITPRLALGATVNFWRGDWTEDDVVGKISLEGTELPSSLMFSQASRIRGTNVGLGLMLTYPRWSIGLVHQGPLVSDFHNRTSVTFSGLPVPPSEELSGTLRFPRSFGIGGAWHPAPRWTVALDLTRDQWSDTVVDTPETGPQNLFDGLPPDRTSTRDTLSVNAGAERLFVGQSFVVPLRFGAAWEPQGARSPYTLDPVNFVMLAVGTGYNTNSLKLDAAFQYRWTTFQDGESYGLPLPSGLPVAVGERSLREWRLKLSLILRVTDTDKLRRTLHKIFG
jgi:long-chain fatty acid transport protein